MKEQTNTTELNLKDNERNVNFHEKNRFLRKMCYHMELLTIILNCLVMVKLLFFILYII